MNSDFHLIIDVTISLSMQWFTLGQKACHPSKLILSPLCENVTIGSCIDALSAIFNFHKLEREILYSRALGLVWSLNVSNDENEKN